MCGRSSLHEEPQKLLESYGLPQHLPGFSPRFNIAPTQNQWAIRTTRHDKLEACELRWGLVPSWASDPGVGARMINARAETIAEKPAYRDALQGGRCLIITDGYYEWAKTGGGKTPFRFQMADGRPFVFAGLWDKWRKGEESLESCTIITTQAANSVAHIHDRMPAILDFADSLSWLRSTSVADVLPLLRPYTHTDLTAFAVSRAVNNAANDTIECIQPAVAMPDERASQPLDLFT